MPQFLAPICNDQLIDVNGDPLVGGQIETYLAGSTTPAQTYTDDSGSVPQSNPIILNSLGYAPNPIWLTGGVSYKFVIKNAAGVTQRTVDDIAGVNDASVSQSEWVESGFVTTYINATSFSVPGDQTNVLQIGRRVRTTNTSGLVYSTISNSVFAAGITTVTLTNDSTTLDSGLNAVAYALLSPNPLSIPNIPVSKLTGVLPLVNGGTGSSTGPLLRGHINGLRMSTAGSSATMTIGAGQAVDSVTAALMTLAESISKTTSAWVVGTGNGGLDTGAIANNTWYHFHLIRRPDTGVVDVLISLSPTAPTLPANYTQFRRIGSGRTNGSAQWVRFFQTGDQFLWDNLGTLDFDGTSTTTATLTTLLVPTGVKVRVLLNVLDNNGVAGTGVYISDPDVADVAPSLTAWPLGSAGAPINGSVGRNQVQVSTNTSAQIRHRSTRADSTLRIATVGWIDTRGRDA